MRVAILAGGLATRLRPLTTDLPKSLIPVAGKPFLEHQLTMLAVRGLCEVVLCVGYLGQLIQQVFQDGSKYGVKISYSFDGPNPLGTGGALIRALPLLGSEFFVIYGDSYLPIEYAPVADFFLRTGKLGCMTVFRNEGRYDKSNVVFKDAEIKVYDKIRRFPEMDYIDYGLSAFRSKAFDGFAADKPLDLAEIMQKLVAQGQLAGYEVKERFYEIGSREGLAEIETVLGNI